MRVMVVTGGFPSLSETFIFQKVLGLARQGFEVEVVARRRGDRRPYQAQLAAAPSTLSVQYLPSTQPEPLAAARLPVMLAKALALHGRDARRWVGYLAGRYGKGAALGRKLYRLLPFLGKRPDVTHLEFATLALDFGDLIHLLPGRKVISCRGADIDILPRARPTLAAAIQDVLRGVDAVHCVSREMVRSALTFGLNPERAFVNNPSIDWRYFEPVERPPQRDRFTIVSVVRLHWKKGISDALRALARLHERGVRAHYVLVGDGEHEEAVRFDVWDLGLSDHVTLAGPQDRAAVRAALADADAFLLPSVSEGLSNAVLEAMATGLPVVTTDAGGMAEAVRDGVDGFVVRRRDSEGMARCLERLARSPDLRRQMGQAACERVREHFGIERQIRVFGEVYRSLAETGTLPRELSYAS